MSRLENLKKTKGNSGVYSRTVQEKEPRSHSWLVIFFMVLVLGGLIYLVIFSGLLDIKKVEVKGYSSPLAVQGIAQEMVEKNLISKNILLFKKRELEKALMGDPQIQELSIKRYLPGKIIIEITESKPAMIWSAAGDKYLIDDRGVVIAPAVEEKLPEVYDGSNIKTKPGERVCSPTFIKFINDIYKGFQGSAGAPLSKITIFDILTDVHAMSADGWTVYFDASKNAEGQLRNLSRIVEEARATNHRLEYIDIRLDNKIFYK